MSVEQHAQDPGAALAAVAVEGASQRIRPHQPELVCVVHGRLQLVDAEVHGDVDERADGFCDRDAVARRDVVAGEPCPTVRNDPA
jgi:hypothetical protein